MEMAKTYDPKSFEKKIYQNWVDKKYFHAEADPDKTPFTIVIPPPNITGQLHMGHALNHSIQDAIIRFKRMQGYCALWLPGTDHASIATEVKIVEDMAKDGLTKNDLGREKFLERAFEWKAKYGGRIIEQMKCLGNSCDWDRLAFTMDERCSKAVKHVFVDLYNKGLIYRGDRIINWCPSCRTAISDAEVDYAEQDSFFWHIRYTSPDGKHEVIVATTRPETMLGDTAVAVHPDDERYRELVGKTLVLPLVGREIPVVADSYVDKEFGTGAVKITPAHDPNDFEVGLRHNLEVIRVMDDGGVINEKGGKYCGLDRFEARKRIVEDLKAGGALVKIEPHKHNVGSCYRCKTTIEPIVSKQWFVKMKPLAEPAIEAVRDKSVKFIPKRFEKIYYNWMENIRDWCISRQLWWGHRIPAYYCEECGHMEVSETDVFSCPKCGSKKIHQDEDVLDTWFSSALWPFSTLGFPENTADLNYFYPTDVLVTAYDIIFFWVARMIFSGIEHMHKVPFRDVLMTGLVRDKYGRKMSKSLGNGIDPLEVIEQYGADTLRFALLNGTAAGGDTRYSEEKIEGCRNFMNKLWNASRFVNMNLEGHKLRGVEECKLDVSDKWILKKLNDTVRYVTAKQEKYEFGASGAKLYDFVWSDFCDWYIEMAKPVLYGESERAREDKLSVLLYVLKTVLKLLHPFIPFITEEIYQSVPHCSESIMISEYPTYNKKFNFVQKARSMENVMELIRGVRNLRQEMNVSVGKRTRLYIVPLKDKASFTECLSYIEKLSYASEVKFVGSKEEIGEKTVALLTPTAEVYVALGDLVDTEKERARLEGECKNARAELARAQGKLANKGFTDKAPRNLVEAEEEKVKKFTELLSNLEEKLAKL